jgi:hypothetical protein
MSHPTQPRPVPARIGVAVTFAALGEIERQAVEAALRCAREAAGNWVLAFDNYGLAPIDPNRQDVDLLVYLGESSRFNSVAGGLAQRVPVVFIKSTVESLLDRPAGSAPRYRMSTGVLGIAQALGQAAPLAPTADWTSLPWPEELAGLVHLDPGEQGYVNISLETFREAAQRRGIEWVRGLPPGGQPFSVFLTMHDPAAARLAHYALTHWPQCTVIAADGMSSTTAPDGSPWPDRLIRVRHWTALSRSASNLRYHEQLGQPLPDIDSPGMLFGTLFFLDALLGAGADPACLEATGRALGPLGALRMTASGHPDPERVIIFRGRKWSVSKIRL